MPCSEGYGLRNSCFYEWRFPNNLHSLSFSNLSEAIRQFSPQVTLVALVVIPAQDRGLLAPRALVLVADARAQAQ